MPTGPSELPRPWHIRCLAQGMLATSSQTRRASAATLMAAASLCSLVTRCAVANSNSNDGKLILTPSRQGDGCDDGSESRRGEPWRCNVFPYAIVTCPALPHEYTDKRESSASGDHASMQAEAAYYLQSVQQSQAEAKDKHFPLFADTQASSYRSLDRAYILTVVLLQRLDRFLSEQSCSPYTLQADDLASSSGVLPPKELFAWLVRLREMRINTDTKRDSLPEPPLLGRIHCVQGVERDETESRRRTARRGLHTLKNTVAAREDGSWRVNR